MDDRPWGQAAFDPTQETSPDPFATADDATFPWPPGRRLTGLEALGETIRQSLFEPTRFFRAMPLPSPLGPALVYYVLISVASAGITLFWGTFFSLFVPPDGFLATLLGVTEGDFDARLTNFLFSPLVSLLGLGIGTLIFHVALVIFGGAHKGLGASLRTFAYTVTPQLLVIVPAIGAFVAYGWWIVLAVIGLREVHGTTTGRAAAAIIVPVVALAIIGAMLAVFALLATVPF